MNELLVENIKRNVGALLENYSFLESILFVGNFIAGLEAYVRDLEIYDKKTLKSLLFLQTDIPAVPPLCPKLLKVAEDGESLGYKIMELSAQEVRARETYEAASSAHQGTKTEIIITYQQIALAVRGMLTAKYGFSHSNTKSNKLHSNNNLACLN